MEFWLWMPQLFACTRARIKTQVNRGLSPIIALNQVQWNVRQDHTRATWHGALRIVIDGEAYHQ